MMRIIYFTIAALFATQSVALSCMQLTPETMYQWAHKAEEIYVPVYGSFSYQSFEDPNKDTGNTINNLPKGYEIPGQFSGKFLTRGGLGSVLDTDVTIRVTCAAHWCGGPPSSDVSLAVLERKGDAYILHQNACPSSVFPNPQNRELKAFRSCLSGKHCQAR